MLLSGCCSNKPIPEIIEIESIELVESAPEVILEKVPVNIKEKCKEPDLAKYYKKIKTNEDVLKLYNEYKSKYRICIAMLTEWANPG